MSEIDMNKIIPVKYEVLEQFRAQTSALSAYLRAVKAKDKNLGMKAVELYIAHDKAIKCLLELMGVDYRLDGQQGGKQ